MAASIVLELCVDPAVGGTIYRQWIQLQGSVLITETYTHLYEKGSQYSDRTKKGLAVGFTSTSLSSIASPTSGSWIFWSHWIQIQIES